MIRLVLLDIDGTLTKDRNTEAFDPDAIAAVQDVVNKYVVGLVTGNALIVTQALSRYIGLPRGSPLIAENGCLVDYRGEVHELCEDLNLRDIALRLMKVIPGLRPTYQFNYRKFDITLWAPRDPNELVEVVKAELRKMNLDGKVRVSHSGYALHLQPINSSKATAIKYLCGVIGVSCNEVVYVGDSDTDIDAMNVVGYGVAVSNATDGLKRRAKIILEKPSGKGVVDFLKNYLPKL
ncbi:MAG: phosphoglycolate phosphatase [Vulcanisaeta sp.]|jgi:phosphoglycolate phosphatase (TIGR01487 family)|uniref:Phosphoglycolate phosphatase n=1 Tax=Vulcanisaeta moutnovskia (strain 768-28) TaxID=985053 RepID=F0QUE3_VULM7|nr:phosphoglycolate phosphatase [Vulcanisaeta moutnovskia]ADY01852.1 SPP-like hydrolase [Vulcanisaeta moutnovskia 768-28]